MKVDDAQMYFSIHRTVHSNFFLCCQGKCEKNIAITFLVNFPIRIIVDDTLGIYFYNVDIVSK